MPDRWEFDGKDVTALELLLLSWILGCVETTYGDGFLSLERWTPQPPPFPCYYARFVMRYIVAAYQAQRLVCA